MAVLCCGILWVPFCTILASHIPSLSSQLTTCECGPVCEFYEDPGLFLRIVQTAEVDAQVHKANGFSITPKLYRKLVYRAYIVAVFG
jgi:hypothetical protein